MPFTTWCQGLVADGTDIVNANGSPVLLRGYGPGGWQIMEGYIYDANLGFCGISA